MEIDINHHDGHHDDVEKLLRNTLSNARKSYDIRHSSDLTTFWKKKKKIKQTDNNEPQTGQLDSRDF